MFSKRFTLVSLFGIPIRIDATWLLTLALVVYTLTHFFAGSAPGLSAATYWLMSLVAALAFFACLVLHEMGHALVARALGVPIRGITLFLFGGVAEMENDPRSARDEFLIAIAGPAVSAVLGVGFLLLSLAGWVTPIAVVLAYLGVINLAVLAFNLIPAFPLDGGRVFRAILWALTGSLRRATWFASGVGQGFAWVLIALGALEFLGGHVFGGLWLALIGLFVNGAARASYQDVMTRQFLQGEPLSRVLSTDPVVVSPELSLRAFVQDYVYRYRQRAFPVCDDGRLVGGVSTLALTRWPRQEWSLHTVAEAMEPIPSAICVSPDVSALEALKKMNEAGSGRLLVVDAGRLVGLVSLEELLGYLELKSELEGEPARPTEAEPIDRIDRPRPMILAKPDGKRASEAGVTQEV